MTRAALIRRLSVVVVVLYLSLAWVAYVRLGGLSGGLVLMDLRPWGYDLEGVRAYVTALGFAGGEMYRDVYLLLDAVFLTALTVLLLVLAVSFRAHWLGWVAGIAALGYFGLDIAENLTVSEMIGTAPAALTETQVAKAVVLTQGKFAALVIAAASLFAAWRRGVSG